MDVLANLALGFQTAMSLSNLLYCLIGVFLGTPIGVLPGLGPVATIAMLLPITFGLPPVSALIMLAGIYYGAQYGGSTTAILVNLPGESSSVVTALDGYQMARQGKAGLALATAAIGSFFAGTVCDAADRLIRAAAGGGGAAVRSGRVFLADGARPRRLDRAGHGSLLHALGMVVARPAAGPGRHRRQFRRRALQLRASRSWPTASASSSVAMGMFGLGEIIANLEHEATRSVRDHEGDRTHADARRLEAHHRADPARHGARLGAWASCPAAARCSRRFGAYSLEKKLSKTPEQFGQGAIEGVAAPEAANNAGAQTSFIPMLTLGIPSNPVMALMIGAMIIQGIQPGPSVMTEQPALFWGVVVSMWIGNLLLLVLNLPLIGLWVQDDLGAVPPALSGDHGVLRHRRVQPQQHRRSTCI